MRLSRFFMPTLKETPGDAQIASHRLMLRAGMVRQTSSGIYTWLPLGLKVLRKLEKIVREEQNQAGAVELLMPTLQSADLWRESGRYDGYGKEMLRIKDRHDRDMLYGPTNEEQITDIMRNSVQSYKNLPHTLYHIQWKFRDEVRPRFGVMRGREFLMKDAYSFDITTEDARKTYNRMFIAYLKTFARMGLTAIPMKADTGPIGGDMSHEFLVLAETGESAVYFDKAFDDMDWKTLEVNYEDANSVSDLVQKFTNLYAASDEKHTDEEFEARVPENRRVAGRGVEVGHIFYLGTKYSKTMKATFMNKDGQETAIEMGCYGIGVSRLVGAIIEANHDEKGIVWPDEVAPFEVAILNLRSSDEAVSALCESVYKACQNAGFDALYDDRDERAGVKFADSELIGIPYTLSVGPRGAAQNKIEFKDRRTGIMEELNLEEVLHKLQTKFEKR